MHLPQWLLPTQFPFVLACYHVICLLCGSQKFDSVFLFSSPPLASLIQLAASFLPSAPPLHSLPFRFSSSAVLAGDEKHYFTELLHPGGHCLAFGRR